MLDEYFKREKTRERLRRGSLGEHLDALTDHLSSQSYTWFTIKQYLGGIVHFGRWLDRSRSLLEDLDEAVISKFASHLRRCRCRSEYHGARCARSSEVLPACRRVLDYLRQAGVARPPKEPVIPEVIVAFEEWMRGHRGTADRTLADYRYYVTRLLATGVVIHRLGAKQLRDHVLLGSQPRRAQSQVMVRALRMFVRFLVATGRCPAHLDGAVPSVACWRLANLPRHLPASDVRRLVAGCPPTALGRRDRAVLLLLAHLGLRRGDLAALRLGDLDWAHGRLRVRGKTGRSVWLPLPQRVGDAILGYLRRGRPPTASDHVFVRAFAPYRALSASGFSTTTERAFIRADVSSPTKGTHIFRHTAATEMLRRGASLDEIGLLLRHTSRETTLQYAKVDVRLLQSIALPWPETSP
jgi:integrase/recombinase XerD